MDLQTLQGKFTGQEKQSLTGGASAASIADMPNNKNLIDTIPAFRVSSEVGEAIRQVAEKDRRTITDVARAFLERGVAQWRRDGQLFEPDIPWPENATVERAESIDPEQQKSARPATKKRGGKR